MDAETDGSSRAAQGAPEIEEDETHPGLFGRLFGAIWTPEPSAEQSVQDPADGQARVLQSALPGLGNLRRMRVDDVVIPKAEIVAVPLDIGREELVGVFRDSGMTRLPVYDGTLDSPVGLIHLKDFALSHGFNGNTPEFALKPLLRPLLYVPPSMSIGVLLQKMQSDRMHMALVIDEYGGVDGLVTIEDLIEQVIGEIEDEHDVDEGQFWVQETPGVYVAQARTPLDEFEAEIGIKLVDGDDEEDVDTLGGLVFMLTGKVPQRGEVVPHDSGAEFEVIDADPRRIKRLRVRLPGAAAA